MHAFRSLQEKTTGVTILNALDSGCQQLKDTTRTQVWVDMSSYTVQRPDQPIQKHTIPPLNIQVPGDHLYIDACLAYTTLVLRGVDISDAITGLCSYTSSWRRMEQV